MDPGFEARSDLEVPEEASPAPEYLPHGSEIVSVRHFLRAKSKLSTELVLSILSYTSYSSFQANSHREIQESYHTPYDASIGYHIAGIYLTLAIDNMDHQTGDVFMPLSVRFKIRSHDQGWTTDPRVLGIYGGSSTWFEASILRPSNDGDRPQPPQEVFPQRILPSQAAPKYKGWDFVPNQAPEDGTPVSYMWMVQSNATADRDTRVHEIEWHRGEPQLDEEQLLALGRGGGYGFVENLQDGDVIALWAVAKKAAWVNHVVEAEILVTYDL